jgi:succinate dehydrogenase / fumarate reductase iron-sulfur subunit
MAETWNITLKLSRQKQGEKPHFDEIRMDVNPDENVIDLVERAWAFHDRTLVYAHACHHSTCGACGMRVNDTEKLTCITPVRSVVANGGTLKVEPLRNFPVVSDLVVDMGELYRRMDMVGHHSVNSDRREAIQPDFRPAGPAETGEDFIRLSDCIECGLCMSACPMYGSTPDYLGPAVLAGAHQADLDSKPALYDLVDSTNGVWRCHSVFECTAVCPSNVDPGWRIMELRRKVVGGRIRNIFSPRKTAEADK